ncbi:hypothetical protein [Bosea thiooxidans]
MIFYFDADISCIEKIEDVVLFESTQELIRAYRKGFHRIIISRGICDWLILNLSLSEFDKATLARIRGEFTQFGGIRSDAEIWVEVVLDGDSMTRRGKAIICPIKFILSSLILERTVLLVENSHSDGVLQRFILDNICRRKGFGRVEFEAGNAGGDSLEHAARTYLNDRRITFAIVDSDLDYPSEKIPMKVAKFNSVMAEIGWVASAIVYPECREVENLLTAVIVAMLKCSQEKRHVFSELDKISLMESKERLEGRFWRYFDIKNGISIDRSKKLSWIEERMDKCGLESIDGISSKVVELLNEDNAALSEFAKEITSDRWWSESGRCYSLPLWATIAAGVSRT